jgi:hypothetical protein
MCGGAIIFDYIPARRRVSAADFWPDSEADAEDPHAPRASGERGRHAQLPFLSALFLGLFRFRSSDAGCWLI